MRKRLFSSIALFLTACGGGTGLTTTGGDGGMQQGPSPDMADPNAIVLAMTSFTVPAGSEIYKCQNFANPVGADIEVQSFESHMTPGSHHMLVFYKDNLTNSALEDCSGLEFAPTPYGTQRPDDGVTFPPGVAAQILKTQGLRLQSHYLNATQQPITASVRVVLHPAAPGSVQQNAGVFFFLNNNLSIPPTGQPFSLTQTCTIPVDLNVIKADSHMHQHATHFIATNAGRTVYETSDWNEPKPTLFDPPFQYAAGSTVTFTCTWVNNTGMTLTFGESARTNEMCIFSGNVYPTVMGYNILPCY
jgi:hypothetical protein